MSMDPDKSELRARVIAARDAIPADERAARSARLLDAALRLPAIDAADAVFCFVSHGSEVDTRPLIDALLASGKQVAVPLILPRPDDPARRMLAVPIRSRDELVSGVMGIPSPTRTPSEIANLRSEIGFTPCLVLVPGVAFAQRGDGRVDRLGYGGGYYDRYLARLAERPGPVATLALGFTEQLVPAVPAEPHDVPIDTLLTC